VVKNTFGYVEIPLQRIHLELTNVCNLNCAFCPKSVMRRPLGFMEEALAKRAISEIAANNLCEKITLHVMGEPTLHPRFFEILEHAAAEEQRIGLTTNGTTLGGDFGKRLLEYELHQVDISLQTPDEVSFAFRKAGKLKFDRYLDNIMEFFSTYCTRYPKTIFKFRILNTSLNKRQMESRLGGVDIITSNNELKRLVKLYALSIYNRINFNISKQYIFHRRLDSLVRYKWNVIEVMPNVFLETYLLSGWGNAFEDGIKPSNYGYCYGMKDHFGILYNGDVVLCCIDYDGKTAFGNISNSSLEGVLSSPMLKEVMEGFKKYRLVHTYCKRCQGSHSYFSSMLKPVVSVLALKILKGFFYKHTKLFE